MSNMIMWKKPAKIRSTEEHNNMWSSDCGVPGTYVSNMSPEDERTWKGKIVKRVDDEYQIELRKLHGGSNVLLIIANKGYKYNGIHYYDDNNPPTWDFNPTFRFSTNGPLQGHLKLMVELEEVISEARTALFDLVSGVRTREDFTKGKN